jgi:hypothetical protein
MIIHRVDIRWMIVTFSMATRLIIDIHRRAIVEHFEHSTRGILNK